MNNSTQLFNVWTWNGVAYTLELSEDQNISLEQAYKQAKLSQEMDIENSIGFDGDIREEVIANSDPVKQIIAPVGLDIITEGVTDECEVIDSWIF